MRQGRALGEPRRTARVLDVDGVVSIERRHPAADGTVVDRRRAHRVPGLIAQDDDVFELRQLASDVGDHLPVVAALERRRAEQRADPRLTRDIGQLVRPICRVDVDQDRSDPGRGVLHEHPFDAVGRPDADPITHAHFAGQQGAGQPIDGGIELAVGEPDALVARDDGLTVGMGFGRAPQALADRLAQQRRGRRPAGIREGWEAGWDGAAHVEGAPRATRWATVAAAGRATTQSPLAGDAGTAGL